MTNMTKQAKQLYIQYITEKAGEDKLKRVRCNTDVKIYDKLKLIDPDTILSGKLFLSNPNILKHSFDHFSFPLLKL